METFKRAETLRYSISGFVASVLVCFFVERLQPELLTFQGWLGFVGALVMFGWILGAEGDIKVLSRIANKAKRKQELSDDFIRLLVVERGATEKILEKILKDLATNLVKAGEDSISFQQEVLHRRCRGAATAEEIARLKALIDERFSVAQECFYKTYDGFAQYGDYFKLRERSFTAYLS